MYGQSVPALISKNVGNTLTNYSTWNNILYNVKAYGAEVDGATDDTAAVQSAINAAFDAGGGAVFFPPGTCITSGIIIKSNVNLVGISNASIIKLKSDSVAHLISSEAASYMDINGLILDGNKANQHGSSGLCVIKLTDCSQVRISRNVCKNSFFAHGVQLVGGSNNTIEECTLRDNGANGIIFTLSTNLFIVKNKIFSNSVRGIADYGTTVSGNMYIQIEGNEIYSNGTDGISFEMDYDTLQPRSSYVMINNNIIRNNTVYGILCQAEHASIINNQVLSNGNAIDAQGIIMQAQFGIIEGNIVKNNAGVGIDLGNCYMVVVSNNHVTYNGCLGIEVASCDHVTVTGNLVARNNAINYGVASAGGIMVYGASDYPHWTGVSDFVTVTGNRILLGTYQNYGIYVDANAHDVVITGNMLYNSGNLGDLFNQSAIVLDRNNGSLSSAPNNVIVNAITNVVIAALSDVFTIQGTTTINTIKFPNVVYPIGKEITLLFTSSLTVNHMATSSGNIDLTGSTNLVVANRSMLRLMCNGTGWTEICRSIK